MDGGNDARARREGLGVVIGLVIEGSDDCSPSVELLMADKHIVLHTHCWALLVATSTTHGSQWEGLSPLCLPVGGGLWRPREHHRPLAEARVGTPVVPFTSRRFCLLAGSSSLQCVGSDSEATLSRTCSLADHDERWVFICLT